MTRMPIPEKTEMVVSEIVDAAYSVHYALGPGLLENVYETCLMHELNKRDLKVARQVVMPIVYDDITLESGLRLDMVVENCVIVELKAVENLLPIHKYQLLTYLKLSGLRLGLLINFNVKLIKDGIRRLIV